MSPDHVLDDALARAPAGGWVAFVGGEPTIDDRLAELASRAVTAGARVLVQTNARRLATKGYAAGLARAGVARLDVSLHGATEEMHDHHTGVPGSFRQSVAGLRRARAARIGFGVTIVVTRSNFRHLSEIVRVAHALGADAVRFAPALPVGRAARGGVVPADELAAPRIAMARRLAESLGLAVSLPADDDATESTVFAGIGATEAAPAVSPSSDHRELSVLRSTDAASAPLRQGAVS